jgi:ABC-type lipoprotein release transport system permease subunit
MLDRELKQGSAELIILTPLDPITFAAMPVVLAAAAALASYLPARSATTVDPVETMRDE